MFPDVLEDFFDEEIFRSIYKQAHGYEYLEDAVYITKVKCGRDPVTHKIKYKEVPKVVKKQVFVPPDLEAVKLILALKDPDSYYAEELRKTGLNITPDMSAAFINFSKSPDIFEPSWAKWNPGIPWRKREREHDALDKGGKANEQPEA